MLQPTPIVDGADSASEIAPSLLCTCMAGCKKYFPTATFIYNVSERGCPGLEKHGCSLPKSVQLCIGLEPHLVELSCNSSHNPSTGMAGKRPCFSNAVQKKS